MGTPGLKLIQDLLAKSVAKWSGDAVKTTEDESNKSIKIEENNTKVEYIETDSIAQNIKIEQDKTECEIPKKQVKEGSKRKLVEVKTEKNRKKTKKTHITPTYGVSDNEDFQKEVDAVKKSDLKDDKSLIMKLLESSAANYTSNADDDVKVIKTDKLKNIQSKKTKLCRKEVGVKTDSIVNFKMEKVDMASNVVNDNHLLRNHGEDKHGVSGLKWKKRRISTKAHKTKYKRKLFSPEEDEILQHAIDTDTISYSSLAKQLGRSSESILTRIKRLKIGDRKCTRREFSLMEDMLIMDRIFEKLPGKRLKDLEMFADETSSEFLSTLGRTRFSTIAIRWGSQLKPWILQFYAGTLNLDINRQLANFLADTFTGFDSIDWSVVADRPEFAGHTIPSLKHLFYVTLFGATKRNQNLESSEITLRNIVENTNMQRGLKKKATPRVLTRQMEVIDYFEQNVRKHGITNFL